MSLRFKRVTEAHAPLILKWRTDPDITRFMYTDLENPSVEKQVAWIRSLQARPDYFAYVICDDETPVGFLSFAEYDPLHRRCSTGSYIYERQYRLKFAATLHPHICAYAFYRLQCHKIVNSIMGANEKVVKLQTLHKTRHVGCLKDHIFKYGEYHDVHLFEILKSDWESQKQRFSLDQLKSAFEDWIEP